MMHSLSEVRIKGEDILNFVLTYRRKEAFKDWTEAQISTELVRAIYTGELLVVLHNGRISGLAIARLLHPKVLWISAILTTRLIDFPNIVKSLYDMYPRVEFVACRRKGKYVRIPIKYFRRLIYG